MILKIKNMKNRIEFSGNLDEKNKIDQESFLRLDSNERVKVCLEISEAILQNQYKNGLLPEDENYTLRIHE